MNKNVCIIHFNTPILTAHLVKSINKHTPGVKIYIFDNSDKSPFVNTFPNVTVFDNTKGQIINFTQWLKKYPNKDKSGGKANKWGSAKHAYSVEKCMELIDQPFVLFDSDVLVKKDFSSLYDEFVCYKGEVINQPGTNNRVKRVLPFVCFINTPLCKQKDIHYFDENYMHGLRFKGNSDNYDTGGALYILTEKNKAPHREIKVADYIVHYGNGSWVDAAEKIRKPKHIPAGEWLKKYREFWSINDDEKNEVLLFEDVFDHIYCLHYLPAENRLPKLKSELQRVGINESAGYFSWAYDFPSPLLDLVYKDKRLNMNTALKSTSRDYIKRVSLKHYEIVKEAYSLGYERILVLEDDVRFHKNLWYINEMLKNLPDADVVMFDKMVSSAAGDFIRYKEYIKKLSADALYGSINESGVFFIFSSCYALNRAGMEKVIEMHENGLMPSDTPFNNAAIKGMFAVTNLAIQEPAFKTREIESYKRINLITSEYEIDEVEKSKPAPPVVKKPAVQVTAPPKKPLPKIVPKPKQQNPVKPAPKPEPKPITPTPLLTKKAMLLEQKKNPRSATMFRKMVGFNKLYDV